MLSAYTSKKNLRDSWIFLDQTFLGLELGTLFPVRESLVSDIPAGDGNIAKLFFTVYTAQTWNEVFCKQPFILDFFSQETKPRF